MLIIVHYRIPSHIKSRQVSLLFVISPISEHFLIGMGLSDDHLSYLTICHLIFVNVSKTV